MIFSVFLDKDVERITRTPSMEHDLSYFFAIAAQNDHRIKGYCKVSLCDYGKTLKVDDVQVDPAYRNHGYGSALVLFAIRLARSFGCFLCITTLIDKTNESALAMFNSLGFITVSCKPTQYRATFVIYY